MFNDIKKEIKEYYNGLNNKQLKKQSDYLHDYFQKHCEELNEAEINAIIHQDIYIWRLIKSKRIFIAKTVKNSK